MSKEIVINGFIVTVNEDQYDGLCNELRNLNVEVEDLDTWETQSPVSCKVYDSKDYLDAAQFYLDQKPPDLMQAGEKLWGCVSYVVKKFYAQMNLSINSYYATRALCLFAIDFYPSVARKLTAAYYNAENYISIYIFI